MKKLINLISVLNIIFFNSCDSKKKKNVFTFAYKYGFRKNFCANPVTVLGSTVSGVIYQGDHDDHGHIGLTDLDLEEVSSINVVKI